MGTITSSIKLILICAVLLIPHLLISQCLGLVKGLLEVEIKECKAINYKNDFKKDIDLSFINNLGPQDRKKFFDNYLGFLVKGLVIASEAQKVDISKTKGALYGSNQSFFISSLKNQQLKDCSQLINKRIMAYVEEHCCMGGVDSPCLLSTDYELKNINVIGLATAVQESKKQKRAKIEYLKDAFAAIKKKDYKAAVEFFSKAKNERKLDLIGYYFFAYSYYKLDRCNKVISLLEENKKLDADHAKHMDEEKYYRKSNYLLTRCYARVGDAKTATNMLGFYLIEPQKYKFEISDSLKNKDFGWIYSSKEYQAYKIKAQKVLSTLPK